MIKSCLSILLLVVGSISYAGKAPGSFEAGKVIERVVCKTDVTQSYALYIPVRGNKEALPIIYFFDPHGDGTLPLRKYKSLADRYGFILAGSNNSKNGNDWTTTENIWRRLFDDTKMRLKINSSRIYTCGFSGGAKVASYVAIQHSEVKGVIANGAGLPDGVSTGDFSFSFTAIAGEGDMNLTDLIAINNELNKTRTRHSIILFDGKHEWAPQNTMKIAFEGLQFDAMQQGFIPKDTAFMNRYIVESRKRNDLYQKQLQAQQGLFTKEQYIKAEYMQHFQQGDTKYWTSTINDLQTKAAMKNIERSMNQRLLAYLSLAFYSLSNRMINSNNNAEAFHFVELYKIADPTNSEAWYLSAILYAREKKMQAAKNDLLNAIKYGFNDQNRFRKQVEFQKLFDQAQFSRLEKKMRLRAN